MAWWEMGMWAMGAALIGAAPFVLWYYWLERRKRYERDLD
jgi:Flp pilus assembly protein TadB